LTSVNARMMGARHNDIPRARCFSVAGGACARAPALPNGSVRYKGTDVDA
jgi:hypothetical protein